MSKTIEERRQSPDSYELGLDNKCLQYKNISVKGGIRCVFVFCESEGSEFVASILGTEQLRVAFDNYRYLMWTRRPNPRIHYACDLDDIGKSRLKSMFRPSFSRWIINDEKSDSEEILFRDGEYEVCIVVSSGRVTSQTYKLDGVVESRVVVHKFQSKDGMHFPLLATLEIPEESLFLEIDMGPVRIKDCDRPNTKPPRGSREINLNSTF
jgi:hypothetical protein